MRIEIENIGPIRIADFELGDLTILCGLNNTGKTYATYALFGFLKEWKQYFSMKNAVLDKMVNNLMSEGWLKIELNDYKDNANQMLKGVCEKYSKNIHKIFAAPESSFSKSKFRVSIDSSKIVFRDEIKRGFSSNETKVISINKSKNSSILEIGAFGQDDVFDIPRVFIRDIIKDAIADSLFRDVIPNSFISSSERTGVAIFRKELDFARNRLLEEIVKNDTKLNPFDIFTKVYDSYALPINHNVDFIRSLSKANDSSGKIAEKHPEIIEYFNSIIQGRYQIVQEKIVYKPDKRKLRLPMDESSSSIRTLLDIGFYLKHYAKPNDILIIDEPEMNLHPENQRKLSRLFAKLVNSGVKVFITTHSDYIVREINTLIMLNNAKKKVKESVMKTYGYKNNELLSPKVIQAYIASPKKMKLPENKIQTTVNTILKCKIDKEQGIYMAGFDKSIIEMNQIQEKIIYGEVS